MRKKIRSLSLSILSLLLGVSLLFPLTVASRGLETLNDWADHLVRGPEDPPYLSLHYRVRKFYFSIDPSPAHPVARR